MRRSGQARKAADETADAALPLGAALPPVNAALPILLLRARESVMAWFRPHLREHGVTDHQWRVLRALAEAGCLEMRELSAACEVQAPSLSRIMPKLVEQGLIDRDNDPSDQRRVLARLTRKGERLVATVSDGSAAIYRDLLAVMGHDRLQALQAALMELIATLDSARTGEVAAGRPGRDAMPGLLTPLPLSGSLVGDAVPKNT